MRPISILFMLFLIGVTGTLKSQDFSIGKRDSIQSDILQEQRFINVFLPASYGENTRATYPVLYLMDGDYNFMYVAGLIEQLSSISEQIPEMIVVGISDKGHENYTLNCTQHDSKINPEGNAENFFSFITEELKPWMNQNYLTSSCDFLVGHSLGGLFVINSMLDKPEKFQNYIAISPSLWWNDYAAKEEVLPFYKQYENLARSLYISIGNEKGMGVMGFVDQLDIGEFSDTYLKKTPLGLDYIFKQYPDENHNSVGLITLRDALKWRFEGYEMTAAMWAETDTFEKYIAHIATMQRMIGDGFHIPENQLKVFVSQALTNGKEAQDALTEFLQSEIPASLSDYYRLLGMIQLGDKDPDAAILSLRKSMELNPDDSKVYTALGKCFDAKGDQGMTKHNHKKAYEIAKSHGARPWYLNQLKANLK